MQLKFNRRPSIGSSIIKTLLKLFLVIVFLCALISALLPIWSMVASTLAMEKITYLDINSPKTEENP